MSNSRFMRCHCWWSVFFSSWRRLDTIRWCVFWVDLQRTMFLASMRGSIYSSNVNFIAQIITHCFTHNFEQCFPLGVVASLLGYQKPTDRWKWKCAYIVLDHATCNLVKKSGRLSSWQRKRNAVTVETARQIYRFMLHIQRDKMKCKYKHQFFFFFVWVCFIVKHPRSVSLECDVSECVDAWCDTRTRIYKHTRVCMQLDG